MNLPSSMADFEPCDLLTYIYEIIHICTAVVDESEE